MFDADRPILKSEHDKLNRTLFSKYLARCILDHKEPESLVIGLTGGWGVGKTSVINLTLEELHFAASNMLEEEKPIILNFSPWSYSTQNQLIYSFFRRLSSALRDSTNLKNAEQIIHLLELYVSFFTHLPIPKALRKKPSFWKKLFHHNHEDVYGWESGRDLTQIKAELNILLRQQNIKIIIIIDNISRMLDIEIKQIFQIIKSMGDYANTVYLLAFDKEQVIHAVNRVDGRGGENYIEKLVQLPFEVPPIMQQDLENILFDRLKTIIQTVPENSWDREYWANIYYSSLKFFFKNCRDITRYVNTLSFRYPRVKDVVNPVDYFALTAIEVFCPAIYSGIRDNKDLFTALVENVYTLNPEKSSKDKLRYNEILQRSEGMSREKLHDLLLNLFPRLHRVFYPDTPLYHTEATARKNRRICSPDIFDVYFRLSMTTGFIPESEFKTILSLAGDKEGFSQALTRLNQDNRILKFLDLLDSTAANEISPKDIRTVVCALLDNGDLFPEGESSPLSLNTPMRIHRIIHRLLKRLDETEERFRVLKQAIQESTKSVHSLVHELTTQEQEHTEHSDSYVPVEFRDLTPPQLQTLQQLALERIQFWANAGRLVEHPKLLTILYIWKTWGDNEEYKHQVEEIVKTDRGLIAFLLATLKDPIDQAMTKYEKTPEWKKSLKYIEDFIPTLALQAHAKALFEDMYFEKLHEREQLALMIFLDLIQAQTTKVIPKTTV
ncbi:MAG: hypothetical protein A3E83_05110 [Gammaproteobacteria bacterium RIFCSPHIGHO2_12_FULL_41_20]|nr:MAG: hypothetical protein A3E83_05110 [Gammaproteobacteria bacterium RIFCSPHIGHO2_12_FULL_41_20]